MFRNYSRDFYQPVVYKFKTRNIASKDFSLSNFEKFIFVIICGAVYQLLASPSQKKKKKRKRLELHIAKTSQNSRAGREFRDPQLQPARFKD